MLSHIFSLNFLKRVTYSMLCLIAHSFLNLLPEEEIITATQVYPLLRIRVTLVPVALNGYTLSHALLAAASPQLVPWLTVGEHTK